MSARPTPRRIRAERRDFVHYRVKCPHCGTAIGPRNVTREFLDVPPDPPYAASVRCAKCGEDVYVEFAAAA